MITDSGDVVQAGFIQYEPEVLEAKGRQTCKDDPCSYEMKKDGECLCFNEEQDNQPGHPEHG